MPKNQKKDKTPKIRARQGRGLDELMKKRVRVRSEGAEAKRTLLQRVFGKNKAKKQVATSSAREQIADQMARVAGARIVGTGAIEAAAALAAKAQNAPSDSGTEEEQVTALGGIEKVAGAVGGDLSRESVQGLEESTKKTLDEQSQAAQAARTAGKRRKQHQAKLSSAKSLVKKGLFSTLSPMDATLPTSIASRGFNFLFGKKLFGWAIALLLVSGGYALLSHLSGESSLAFIHQAFAKELGDLGQGAGNVIGIIATFFVKIIAGVLWFVLYWMGDLMDNTFILEGDMGEKLRSVWVIVRNLVNIFFALALVIVAFMSVIGYGDESGNYAMKKFIPKMALALIAVNFTFLGCRLVLDVNNVLTTAIFSIPQSVTTLADIGPTGTAGVKIFKKFKCLDTQGSIDLETANTVALTKEAPGVINQLGGVCFATVRAANYNKTTDVINLDASAFNKKDFVWAMATQFQGLHNLNQATQLTSPNFSTLTVNALFSIIFAIIYATAYIAMFIILLARMVVLWITIMLSPLAAIAIVLPDLLPDDLNITKKFLSHAFVPAKMAVPLAFGYILVSQMSVGINTGDPIFQQGAIDLTEGGELARSITIPTLMYGAASIAVIWMGVFTASKDVVGSEFVDQWIKDPVQRAGASVAKWPTYLRVIPTPAGMASYSNISAAVEEIGDLKARERSAADQKYADIIAQQMGYGKSETRDALKQLEVILESKKIQNPKEVRALLKTVASDEGYKKEFQDVMIRYADTDWDNKRKAAQIIDGKYTKIDELKTDVGKDKDSEAIRTKVKNFAVGGGGDMGGGKINYDPTAQHEFADKEVDIDVTQFSEGLKTELNLNKDDTSTKVGIGDLGANKFFTLYKEKMTPGERQAVARSNLFTDIAAEGKFTEFKNLAKTDPELRTKIETSLSKTDSVVNNNVITLLKAIYGMTEEEGNTLRARYEET
ncbi:MAG: hypothetical protein U1C97_02205 [Candidatus Gracilibacteria bacterium]|nr:hypothetical protein [Candidatus Gracilibacteria bacterium]